MTKRVFIVHGWDGSPREPLHAWLSKACIKRGLDARALAMPHTDTPTIDDWVAHLKKNVGIVDGETFFIGHSIGCQTIMRYLSSQTERSGGAVFIAGWFTLIGLGDEEQKIAAPWLERDINIGAVKRALPRSVAIFSDNDPYVPLSDSKLFKNYLNSEILVEKGKGHFTEDDGVTELPSALIAILKLTGTK